MKAIQIHKNQAGEIIGWSSGQGYVKSKGNVSEIVKVSDAVHQKIFTPSFELKEVDGKYVAEKTEHAKAKELDNIERKALKEKFEDGTATDADVKEAIKRLFK